MMKKTILLFVIALSLLFVSCGESERTARDDLSAQELAEMVEAAMSNRELLDDSSERYIKARISKGVLSGSATQYVFKTSLSRVCDEYGVIKSSSAEDASSICEEINGSLDRRREEWDDRYYSEEKPKIFAAEARRFGNYVIYGVLAPSELEAIFDIAEDTIYNKQTGDNKRQYE